MFVFISYSHDDRSRAAEVKEIFDDLEVESFVAHEDIGVSKKWKVEIMSALTRCDVFVCLLSENFYGSQWCVQESGIASFLNRPIITFGDVSAKVTEYENQRSKWSGDD